MNLNRSLAVLVCAVAFMAGAAPGYAADAWRVVQMVGAVKVGGTGVTPVAVTNDQTLPGGAWLETAPGARAILVRGTETMAVSPGSRVQLPFEKINGNTQVLQSLGSVLYQIGKEKAPHFQVETPYLAAVVKGTTFTVTVKDGEASVDVTEGLVQVATPDLSDTQYVGAGFTATIREDEKNITVDRTAAGLSPAKADEPKSVTPPVVIAHAIGDVVIDVKEVSGGLAGGTLEPRAANAPAAVLTTALNAVNAIGAAEGNANGNNGNGLGLGVNTDLGNGNNGNGNGNGVDLGVDVDLGNGNNGNGNGNGSGPGVTVDLGNGNGLGVGLGNGNNGNGNGLGLELGNGNGNGLGLGKRNTGNGNGS